MKQVDILFIHPNASRRIYQDLSSEHSAIEPPIWAALLANHCRTRGFDSLILDCEAERLTDKQAAVIIKDINPRIACFVVYGQQPSAASQNMSGATSLCDELRNISNIPTLFVGGHVAALPREVLSQHDSIDMVCQNEGVYTISNLLQVTDLSDATQLKKVNGLCFRERDIDWITVNPSQGIVARKDLEHDLPGMAWDLLPDISKYRTAGWHSWPNKSEKAPFASLYTSLGCPYRCSFCMINIINRTDPSEGVSAADSNKWRYWNPDFIIKEFDKIAAMGVKNVKIADELFVLNPRHFIEVCDKIIERKYDFNIWAYSRVDTCKEKYLDKLKEAGVNWLALGIENPNKTLRQEIHKDHFEDVKVTELIDRIRGAGINISANYIFGLPMDTRESMQGTLDFAMDNLAEMVNVYSAMAYPGSPLYLQAKQNGWKLPDTYAGYSQHSYETQNLPNDNLTSAEILKFRDEAWMKYHTHEPYLNLLESKFGIEARKNVEDMTKIKLKRKLLGD